MLRGKERKKERIDMQRLTARGKEQWERLPKEYIYKKE